MGCFLRIAWSLLCARFGRAGLMISPDFFLCRFFRSFSTKYRLSSSSFVLIYKTNTLCQFTSWARQLSSQCMLRDGGQSHLLHLDINEFAVARLRERFSICFKSANDHTDAGHSKCLTFPLKRYITVWLLLLAPNLIAAFCSWAKNYAGAGNFTACRIHFTVFYAPCHNKSCVKLSVSLRLASQTNYELCPPVYFDRIIFNARLNRYVTLVRASTKYARTMSEPSKNGARTRDNKRWKNERTEARKRV